VTLALVRRLHDSGTGRTWDRVFLFSVEKPEDFDAAEAWLNEHYPITRADGR
jgi:hypothetical protein